MKRSIGDRLCPGPTQRQSTPANRSRDEHTQLEAFSLVSQDSHTSSSLYSLLSAREASATARPLPFLRRLFRLIKAVVPSLLHPPIPTLPTGPTGYASSSLSKYSSSVSSSSSSLSDEEEEDSDAKANDRPNFSRAFDLASCKLNSVGMNGPDGFLPWTLAPD